MTAGCPVPAVGVRLVARWLPVPAPVLARLRQAAAAASVWAGGVYDLSGPRLSIWSHPWAGPGADRHRSRWLGAVDLASDPSGLARPQFHPAVASIATLRDHVNALAGRPLWPVGWRTWSPLPRPAPGSGLRRVAPGTWDDGGTGLPAASVAATRQALRAGVLGLLVAWEVRREPWPSDALAAAPSGLVGYPGCLVGTRGRLWLSGVRCGTPGPEGWGAVAVLHQVGGLPPLRTPPAWAQAVAELAAADRIAWHLGVDGQEGGTSAHAGSD